VASIMPGSLVVDIRGSIADTVYSRNASGPIVRERVTPEYHNTEAQQAVRATLTALSKAWSATLSEQQRSDWRAYAHQWPRPNKWGRPCRTIGFTRFVRHNAYYYREHTGLLSADAPSAAPLHPPGLSFTLNPDLDQITIALPPEHYSAPPPLLALYAFGGIPGSAGINNFSGPWRYIGTNLYDGTWTTDPWTVAYPYELTATQKAFAYLVAQSNTTGALSTQSLASAIA